MKVLSALFLLEHPVVIGSLETRSRHNYRRFVKFTFLNFSKISGLRNVVKNLLRRCCKAFSDKNFASITFSMVTPHAILF